MSEIEVTALQANVAPPGRVRTPSREFWRKFRKQRLARCAGAFVVLLVLVAAFAPWIVPFDPESYFDYNALNAGPSWTHWMGVDALGRDEFSRIADPPSYVLNRATLLGFLSSMERAGAARVIIEGGRWLWAEG